MGSQEIASKLNTMSPADCWSFLVLRIPALESSGTIGTIKAGNRLNDQHETWAGGGSTLQRQQYTVNEVDEIENSASGGPLHVNGTASGPAKVTQADNKPPALSEATNKFSAWVDADALGQGQVNLKNWASASVNKTANPGGQASVVQIPLAQYQYDDNGNMTQEVLRNSSNVVINTTNYKWVTISTSS